MVSGMIKGVAPSTRVVFECGDNGMDCFVVSISMEINKMGVNIYIASRCNQVSFCDSGQRSHCEDMLCFRMGCIL